VANAYFRILDEDTESGRYLGTESSAGPWDPQAAHGGPPNALLVRAAERAAAAPEPLHAYRLAAEFIRPVPVGEVSTTAHVVRRARSATLVGVSMHAGGRECLAGRVWLVAARDTAGVASPAAAPPARPPAPPSFSLSFPYGDSLDWHEVRGSAMRPGPAAVWVRPRQPLVEGEALSGLQRTVLVGDSASGVGSALDWSQWSFLNVDLDVHLSRPLRGQWVYMDAETQLGDLGGALARSTISDEDGPVGATAQTLILAPRRR
jgi:hypothetical protein